MKTLSTLLIVVCQLSNVVIGEHVPVIGWANLGSLLNTPTIPAGHVVSSSFLQKDYLDKILGSGPQNICVFVIDKLSISDITKYSDAYNKDSTGSALVNLRTALESSASSLVLPSADSSNLWAYLSSKVDGRVVEVSKPTVNAQSLDNTKTNVLIIKLASTGSDDRENEIRHADKLIGEMISDLGLLSSPYTALLTAKQSPVQQQFQTPEESFKIGRQILQTDEDSSKEFLFLNYTEDSTCKIFLFTRNISVGIDDTQIQLPITSWSLDGSQCVNSTNILNMTSPAINSTQITTFSLKISFRKDPWQYWNAIESVATVTLTNGTIVEQLLNMAFVSTPSSFSYHCVNADALATGTSSEIKNVMFDDLQLQPFDIKDDKFSFANDCIGFFTEAIWMGLVTTLILILILTFGLGMLANLAVMDKFDDPKGKTITIPQTND